MDEYDWLHCKRFILMKRTHHGGIYPLLLLSFILRAWIPSDPVVQM